MAIKLSVDVRDALAQTIIDKLDAGSGSGYVHIYSGTQPIATSVGIASQQLLSEHTLSAVSGVASNGILIFNAISDDNFANTTGVASWARFFDSDNVVVADASISQVGGGGDLQMNTVNIIINGPVRFTSLQWTMPGA